MLGNNLIKDLARKRAPAIIFVEKRARICADRVNGDKLTGSSDKIINS